ncbi:MAG: hypothetical protein COU27_01610 [Candidatus Levybacteria bacterium CG10_big_fil_rev_8_21_14_0_10_36_7]|nr:MAG: hypothetical protein COU27_01610 [Candidatus Levybacteria bacterium CG10_big_fil_rev_8_21_14_0_10_36_7]
MENSKIPEDLKGFLEKVLIDSGLDSLHPDDHQKMVHELFLRLDEHMADVISKNLSEENMEILSNMSEEKKDQREIEAFLKSSMPDSQEIFKKAFEDFRSKYLNQA